MVALNPAIRIFNVDGTIEERWSHDASLINSFYARSVESGLRVERFQRVVKCNGFRINFTGPMSYTVLANGGERIQAEKLGWL